MVIRSKDWKAALKYINRAVSNCPTRNGQPVYGLLDALIIMAEIYAELNRCDLLCHRIYLNRHCNSSTMRNLALLGATKL